MASEATRPVQTAPERGADASSSGAALQHSPWRTRSGLSRGLVALERFLANAGFDRGPWLAVAFGAGICAWFALDNAFQWLSFLALCMAVICLAFGFMSESGRFPFIRQSLLALSLLLAAGCLVVWSKSVLVGAPAIERPMVERFTARILEREEEPARERVRLILAAQLPERATPVRVRVNLPLDLDEPVLDEGAEIRLRARLMPPAPPMLPGGYDFSRTAWFSGLSATGSVLEPVELVTPGETTGSLDSLQARLSRHVRTNLHGSAGGIAAALASGHRGGIAEPDAEAMRDSGLAHLLSISGLHVSAVIAATYLIVIRLLAFWPWLALRVRLPILAAGAAALAGIGYTLLTGAQVPTVRSCVGAVLVLLALALGREALSLRILSVAAFFVLLLWPESIVGPSFQMSFAAVMALIALNSSAAVRKFLAPREESVVRRVSRYAGMLLLTGLLIEIVLMPIGLYHFHRAGIYGALANVVAIPLTTMVVMPLIALALVLDLAGLGTPAWWLVGQAINAMLGVAHWVSSSPGAVTVMPAMGTGRFALFLAGGLWLALWHGKIRFLGLVPAVIGTIALMTMRPPDILISGDGRHVGVTGEIEGTLLVLRDTRSSFVRDNLTELAGMDGELRELSNWPRARCSRDFCVLQLRRGGQDWQILIARSRDIVPERELAAACDRADIVIADRWLPHSCRPRRLKADRRMLSRTGGLAIDLTDFEVTSVAQQQGRHGWWRGR